MDEGITDEQITKLTHGQSGWIPYDELVKRFLAGETIIDIINKESTNGCLILMYYTISENYGHWTCIIDHGDKIEFFDPYGNLIDGVLEKVPVKLKKKMLQTFPTLSLMLFLSGKPVEYNEAKLQRVSDDIGTCGYWTACRINWKDIPLPEFQKIFLELKNRGVDIDKVIYTMYNHKLN